MHFSQRRDFPAYLNLRIVFTSIFANTLFTSFCVVAATNFGQTERHPFGLRPLTGKRIKKQITSAVNDYILRKSHDTNYDAFAVFSNKKVN